MIAPNFDAMHTINAKIHQSKIATLLALRADQGLTWQQDMELKQWQRAQQVEADAVEELRTEAHVRRPRVNFKD